MDIGAEVESGLAQVLGIGALLFGFVLWRLGQLRELTISLRGLRRRVHNHRAGREVRAAYRRGNVRIALLGLGLMGAALLLWKTYAYLGVVNYLARQGPVLDSGIWYRLWTAMLELKQDAVITGFGALGIWVSEWVVDLSRGTGGMHEPKIDRVAHTFVVPDEWRTAEEALWEERIREALAVPGLLEAPVREPVLKAQASRRWRRSWVDWAHYVAAYQRRQEVR